MLIVLWQVLQPPIRKAIFRRILRQKFYSFNPTQWLNYKKTGYPIFIDRCLKPVQIGLFQMPALFFYKKKKLRLSWLRAANFFFPCKLSNSRLQHLNEMFLTEFIIRPCKYELSVRIDVVLNEAILHRSNPQFFCNNCKFPIWSIIITPLC